MGASKCVAYSTVLLYVMIYKRDKMLNLMEIVSQPHATGPPSAGQLNDMLRGSIYQAALLTCPLCWPITPESLLLG